MAAVISLGIATLVLASVLTFTFMLPSTNDLSVDSLYHRAFYDAVEQVENIDLNLSKSLATKDGNALQKYLLDTAINSELAENDIQELPLDDEYKFYTAKVINQIGDYSKYLINKLIDGENLTAKDKQGLENLYKANLSLKQALNDMVNNMGNDYSFESLTSGGMSDAIISGFNDLKNQIALAYEGHTDVVDEKLNTTRSINEIFRSAQRAFNTWSKWEPAERTTANLLKMLDFDFFEVLDSVTIARSRKHIPATFAFVLTLSPLLPLQGVP